MTVEARTQPAEPESLRANTIGLPGVLFQSMTTMAPASAVAFSLVAAIPFTGGALPLATVIALIVCLLVALNIGAVAKISLTARFADKAPRRWQPARW